MVSGLASVCVVYSDCLLVLLGALSSDSNVARSRSISTTHRSKGKDIRGFLHDHLLAGKQRVADELASPQSDGSVGHFGVCWMEEVSTGSGCRTFNFRAVRGRQLWARLG